MCLLHKKSNDKVVKYFWYKSGCNRLVLPNRTEQQIEIFQKSHYDLVRIPNGESCIYLFFLLKVNVVTTQHDGTCLIGRYPRVRKKKKKSYRHHFYISFQWKWNVKSTITTEVATQTTIAISLKTFNMMYVQTRDTHRIDVVREKKE